MNKIKSYLSNAFYNEGIFRYIYVVTLFLCSVCFVNSISEIVKSFVLVWGAFVVKSMFCSSKSVANIGRIKYYSILTAFLAAGIITAVLHLQDNLGANLLMIYHSVICFAVFYGIHIEPDKKKVRREMFLVFKTLIILSTVLSVIGLLIAVFYARIYIDGYCLGLIDNRFTGVYTNPNLAAFSSVIGLISCHFMAYQKHVGNSAKRAVPLWLSLLCVISNVAALLLTDSNASLLFLLTYVLLFLLYKVIGRNTTDARPVLVKKCILFVLSFALVAGGMVFVRGVCQNGVAVVANAMQPAAGEDEAVNATIAYRTTNDLATHTVPGSSVAIGRSDYEVSSGRLMSLRQAMTLFVKNPVMGVGRGNILDYGKRYISGGFEFSDLHNGYLTILISSGLVGLMIIMLFFGMLAVRMLRCLRRRINKKRRDFPVLLSAIGAYTVFALFEKALLFDISFMVVVFWMLLGYATYYLVRYEAKDEKEPVASELVPSLQSMMPAPVYFTEFRNLSNIIMFNEEALNKTV